MTNKEFFDKYPSYKTYFKNFLGAWTFANGDKTLTISDVGEMEMYDQETGGKKVEPVLHFAEEQLPMVLNVTNATTIEEVLGTDNWHDWVGKQIIVGTSKVKAFGKTQDAIRVRDRKPEVISCDKCGQVIVPPAGRSVRDLIRKTQADYGLNLCLDCARALKQEAQE